MTLIEELRAASRLTRPVEHQAADWIEELEQDVKLLKEEVDSLKAELADRASPEMVMALKATIRDLDQQLAEAWKALERIAQSRVVDIARAALEQTK